MAGETLRVATTAGYDDEVIKTETYVCAKSCETLHDSCYSFKPKILKLPVKSFSFIPTHDIC